MTFWPLTNSDFPTDQTFHQFHDLYTELDLHRIMSGFHGAYATGVASQQGTLTPGSVPNVGLANAPIVETKFLELAMSLLDFSPRIPLGTFPILLWYSISVNLNLLQAFSRNPRYSFQMAGFHIKPLIVTVCEGAETWNWCHFEEEILLWYSKS